MDYALARNGIYKTVQGEGALLGVPMVFVRLAGCSIGCRGCDTNYARHEMVPWQEIAERVKAARGSAEWVWVTGGEPADQDLWQLLNALRLCGRVGLATSGMRQLGGAGQLVDFMSVSPHGNDYQLLVRGGSQINLVPGLGGLDLKSWDGFKANDFKHKWVTPMDGGTTSLTDIEAWLEANAHNGWRLGVQAHKSWGKE